MHKDIALGLACSAAFALAVVLYVSAPPRFDRERSAGGSARPEPRAHAVEHGVASSSARPRTDAVSGPAVRLSTRPWAGDSNGKQSAAGAAGAGAVAAPQARHSMRDRSQSTEERAQEERTVQALRRLLASDLRGGIAEVDQVIESARGPGARTAMRCMSLLAEVDDPAVDPALHEYTQADSKLVRLHAAKLLERRGDQAPLASVLADLTADLDAGDQRRKLQALALLQLAGEPASTAKVLPLLEDDSSEIRRGAIFLAKRGLDEGALDAALTPLLQDPDPRVQRAAASALRTTP